jgi:DNA-binding response OmpR family regulator
MPNSQQHILVIDDNEDILVMLKTMLELKRYQVSIRDNAENIEETIFNLQPDVIIMDMLLSGMDGRDVCRELKKNPTTSNIPLLMISAHPNAQSTCLDAGADYFLSKPFDMTEFFDKVSLASVNL